MAAWMAAALVAASSPLSAQVAGSNNVIEVKVQGNKFISATAVLSSVKTRTGQPYDEKLVREDEQRLLKTGRYESVVANVTRTAPGVTVVFVVTERPLVAGISFAGNKTIKTGELLKELPFGEKDPMSRFNVESGKQALLNLYKNKGYYYAQVTYDPGTLAQNQVKYTIVEGPLVHIKKIVFKGNTFFMDLKLRFTVGSSAEFWPFTTGAMDMEQVEKDINAIRELYVNEGFLDAEVDRLLEFSADQSKVVLTFVIHEGVRYRVNQVSFRGNSVFGDRELTTRILFHSGEFYTADGVKTDTKKLQNAYGELGYIDAAVTPRRSFTEKPGFVNLLFEIKELDQYHLGRIDIKGNALTQSRIIRRELRFFPEQLYNTVAVEESRNRLMETRLFEKVTITPVGNAPGVRDALVQVQEGKTTEFLIGAGVSTNSGLLGNVSVTQRNFDWFAPPKSWQDIKEGRAWRGAGQTLAIVAEPGTELMRFHIDWFEPYLFDQPYSLGAKIFYFDRERETYRETRYGLVESVGHRFENKWYGELSSRQENVDIHGLDSDAPPEVRSDSGTSTLVGLKGTLVKDRTDSRWSPSTGDRFRVSYEQVTGDFDFGRADGDYTIYRTVYVDALDRKHVLSGKVGMGKIFGDAPVFEKYYGGGIGSVRGFKYRGISPRSAGTDQQIGGDFETFLGTQYEFPLIGEQLRGVVFIDSGTVEDGFKVSTWRISAGTGVRWILPIFGQIPISLDLAVPLSKSSDDDTQFLSFNIGVTF